MVTEILRPILDTKFGKGKVIRDIRGRITAVEPIPCSEEEQSSLDQSPTLNAVALEVMKVDLAQRTGWMNDSPADSVVKYFDWAQAMWEESVKRAAAMG